MAAGPGGGREVYIPRRVSAGDRAVPGPDARLFRLGGETMGTSWSAAFYAPADFTPGHVAADLQNMLARIVAQMSLWEAESDISRFNAAAPGRWVTLPEPFFSVLSEASDVAQRTDGAFDPALGALTDLWGFGPSGGRTYPPPPEARAHAHIRSGWRGLELDPELKRARQPGGLRLDLNAIAKGDAVDRLSDVLSGHGLKSHLAEIGGELRGRGLKPDGSPWWVEIEERSGAGRPGAVTALVGLAMATSGAYRRAFESGGRRYAHLIDPHTGAADTGGLETVTVFAERCGEADALATALFVMGADKGMEFAASEGIAALFSGPGLAGGRALSPALQDMAE